MEFRVPQYIDIEDKIVGPFSFVQLLYLVGGVSISYVLLRSGLYSLISIPLSGGIMALSFTLVFYSPEKHGRPFVSILESGFRFFFISPRLYTWKRVEKKAQPVELKKRTRVSVTVPNISESNLKSLSWGLDVTGNAFN